METDNVMRTITFYFTGNEKIEKKATITCSLDNPKIALKYQKQ